MRPNIPNLVAAYAATADPGGDERDRVVAVMRAARACWVSPTEDEAFAGAVAALTTVLPERRDVILAEARVLGQRAALLNAIIAGLDVTAEPLDLPDGSLGLLALWDASGASPASPAPGRDDPRSGRFVPRATPWNAS